MQTQRKSASSSKTSSRKTSGKKTSSRSSASSRGASSSSSRSTSRGKQSKSSARGQSSSRGGAKSAGKRSGTASKRSSTSRGKSTNALDLLMQDHREVQKNFRKAERMETGDRELQQLVEQTCAALTLHAEIEEQVFYPAVRQATDDQDMMEEAQVEHDSAKQLIAQLQGMGPRDDRYKATFKVLGEYVNHHIEEEEGQIFRAARRAKLDLDAIGEQIMMLKQGGEAGEAMGQSAAGESSGKRRGNRSDSSGAARGRSRGGRSAGAQDDARESSQGDEDEAE